MRSLDFDITIGMYRLMMLDKVTVKKSVESLADTAVITLPASAFNQALRIEDRVARGDRALIRFGYNSDLTSLPVEFEGYVEEIAADNGALTITCEDELFNFRKEIPDVVLTGVTVKELLTHVAAQIGGLSWPQEGLL